MENMRSNLETEDINWDKANQLEDYIITFLLYQEGKSIELIGIIRNIPTSMVKEHIIQSKMRLSKKENHIYAPIFTQLLSSTKEERIRFLDECSGEDSIKLVNYLKRVLPDIEHPEDKMVAIWIAGHLKAEAILPEIRREFLHKHGGVRRMVCSALRKIPHVENLQVLQKALQDNKPQVRQYAAKALGEIGDSKTLNRLKNLLNKPGEMDYVKRAYKQAILLIESREK